MARINYIFSAPRGSVDNLTFSNWKATNYVKKKIQTNKSNTPAQAKVRTAFSAAVSVIQPINALIKKGFALYSKNQSEYNAAVAHVIKNAVTPDLQIDYTKILISRGGKILPLQNPTVNAATDSLSVSWEDNSNESGNSNPTDKTLFCVINTSKNESSFAIDAAERHEESQSFALPSHWETGDQLHIYIGLTSQKDVSTSQYIGAFSLS